MEKVTLHCDIFHCDELVGRLDIEAGKLQKYEVYTKEPVKRFFPEGTPLIKMLSILQQRVICRERCDDKILNYFGLKEYNAYEIIKRTHGADIDDFMWLKFDGESISWTEIRKR